MSKSAQDALNCTRWHTPSLLDCTLPSKLSRCTQLHSMAYSQHASLYAPKYTLKTLSIALDGTLPACLTVHLQVCSLDAPKHTPEHALKYTPNLSWLYAPIYAPGVLYPETCWVAGAMHWEAGGGWQVAGGRWWVADGGQIMTSVNIRVWTLSFAHSPRQDLIMPPGHGVDNCSLRFCRQGRQLDLGESRSLTQIVQWNLLPVSHQL